MLTHHIQYIHSPECGALETFSGPGFFFNELAHLRQQHPDFHMLTAINTRTQQADARCAFFVQNNTATSPLAAPFGSIEFAADLPETVLDSLLTTLLETAKNTGATTLQLVNYPDCYAPAQAIRLHDLLLRQSFLQLRTDENFHLPVTQQPFVQRIVPAERRRLRKCRNAGFQVEEWPLSDLPDALNFLQRMRQKRGHGLSVHPPDLQRLIQQFPNQFSVFVVRAIDHQPVALSITVRVSPAILHNFLPVSDPDYDSFSPMVLLIDGLYSYCQAQQITLLDLGTSLNSDRSPKPGLARFKRNLGAQVSAKRVFTIRL